MVIPMSNAISEYAVVEVGIVTNVVLWDGALHDPEQVVEGEPGGWQPPQGATLVRITGDTGPAVIGGTWDGVAFTAPAEPPAPPVPPPTAAQVIAQRDALLAMAALRIDPLNDAVELGDATAAEEAALKAWRQYRVKLMRIEQQSGFPASVVWPDAPQ